MRVATLRYPFRWVGVRAVAVTLALCGMGMAGSAFAQEKEKISLTNHPTCLYPWTSNYSGMMTLKPIVNWGGNFGQHEHLTTDLNGLLDWTRQLDNLTRGAPKLYIMVGCQEGGLDAKSPLLGSLNPKLKRPQDATVQDSLNWFCREVTEKYHCTVGVHFDGMGAYNDNPLWDEYLKANLLSKNADGSLIVSGNFGGHVCYNVDLAQEWEKGYLQKRFTQLLEVWPWLKKSGVLYLDANILFPGSPFHHHKPADQLNAYRTLCAWLKLKYGIDVVGEYGGSFVYGYSPLGFTRPNGFTQKNLLAVPAYMDAGGRPNGGEWMETQLAGENSQINGDYSQDKESWKQLATNLKLYEFYYYTLPCLYVNRLLRLEYSEAAKTLTFSDGVQRAVDSAGHLIMLRQGKLMQVDHDVFVPPVWRADREIIAYSDTGKARTWEFPEEWNDVKAVDIYRLTVDGPVSVQKGRDVSSHHIALALAAHEAVTVVPSGADVNAEAPLKPVGEAKFLGEDMSTEGNWMGRYGSEGRSIVAGTQKLPANVRLSYIGTTDRVIDCMSTSSLALQNPDTPTERIACVKTSPLHEIVDITAPSDRTTEVAIYTANLDKRPRHTLVEAIDPVTQKSLASRIIENATESDYVRFGIKGRVQLRLTKLLGENGAENTTDAPVFSGLFLGPQASPPPPMLPALHPLNCSSGWAVALVDKSVGNEPFSVGGVAYAKGVGTCATSIWKEPLYGNASRFRALVGVQDSPTGNGTVEFIVLGDGKVLFRSGIMRGREKAKPIDVDLTGMNKLELQVTDGGDGNAYDFADWIQPELILLGSQRKAP